MAIKIEPVDGPMGAVIHGLDSRKPLTDSDFAVVEKAMLDHIAFVIPDLEENVPWLRDFGRRFGPLVPHILDQYHHPDGFEVSIIARNTGTKESRDTAKPAGAFWHSDLSYEVAPSDAIFLYAAQVPSKGGDTVVANMREAYRTLPDKTKTRLEGKTAVHRWGWNSGGATPQLTAKQRESHPDVIHPVVRPHPKTGVPILYVSPGYTMRIVELEQDESDDLLAELFDHALKPDFQYRHKWSLHSLVGIDNRSSMHCAIDDYTEPRKMLRMIVGCADGRRGEIAA
ncbi:MAG: TauD/TfdA family dioxygenase [Rhodospirillaceae bacterium]